MRLYVAAILAFSPFQDLEKPGDHSIVMSIPALIPAENIDIAAERCREHALTRWKPEEGWYGHHCDIIPITKTFFEESLKAYRAGIVDTTSEGVEDGRSYNFDQEI